MRWGAVGAALLALAVMLGAFGAHALKGRLDEYQMSVYEKAVFYHFIHAMGILVVAALARAGALTESWTMSVCALLALGIVLFSGSLYLLAMTGTRMWGAVTPFGGISFILAWVLLAYRLLRASL